ncbi:MAG: uracil-DNA glycosylase [Candidatus Pacebacteria bacterium]|nr:uracil-DNA glycosylase [Candidatus Paceibacterota bacterium]
MNKELELKKLNQEIRKCRSCGLGKDRKNTVPGEGPANAKIMVIGQAPGALEDKTGRPFVGRAGRFLDELLKIAGIKREKVFITSIVKCFPPKNRKPSEEEIEKDLPYLKKQIEIINPEKFILLGELAFSVFFPGKKLKDFRGKWLKKDKKDYFISYHPAAGIRFVKFKKIIEKDFKKIGKL